MTQKLTESEIENISKSRDFGRLERDLAGFVNCEVFYTIKRLLPADLKTLYKGEREENYESLVLEPNVCQRRTCSHDAVA